MNTQIQGNANWQPWNKNIFTMGYDYAFFMSHATEEKKLTVLPLAEELNKLGISYFLDTGAIHLGKSLHNNLSKGLRRSRFFLPFISKKYLIKKWTMLELNAAIHQHLARPEGFILPVLVGTESQRNCIMEAIPLLNDCRHLVWTGNASEMAVLLAERLRYN